MGDGERSDLFGGSNTQGNNLAPTPPINVFEVRRGVWTHDFTDDEFDDVDQAIKSGAKLASANKTSITVDYSIEQKERAKRLGMKLNPPVKKKGSWL